MFIFDRLFVDIVEEGIWVVDKFEFRNDGIELLFFVEDDIILLLFKVDVDRPRCCVGVVGCIFVLEEVEDEEEDIEDNDCILRLFEFNVDKLWMCGFVAAVDEVDTVTPFLRVFVFTCVLDRLLLLLFIEDEEEVVESCCDCWYGGGILVLLIGEIWGLNCSGNEGLTWSIIWSDSFNKLAW